MLPYLEDAVFLVDTAQRCAAILRYTHRLRLAADAIVTW